MGYSSAEVEQSDALEFIVLSFLVASLCKLITVCHAFKYPSSLAQMLIDGKILPKVVKVLQHSNMHLVREALWAVSNVAHGGSKEQIRLVAIALFPAYSLGNTQLIDMSLLLSRCTLLSWPRPC